MDQDSIVAWIDRILIDLGPVTCQFSHGAPTWFHLTKTGKKGRSICSYVGEHHGKPPAVWCASVEVIRDGLVDDFPDSYFVPPYVGPSGWIGIWTSSLTGQGDLLDLLAHAYEVTLRSRSS